ncbi:hypothetical protein HYE68_009955 [Fusarium pseudograminearum]|nr:hypothetical protein HYE68_009955 [Fusarium pseudograminearum]
MASRADNVTLLKTCQTCFHAKIRCEKSQGSVKCDRCLRLNKTCLFNPSRRRKALRPGLSRNLEAVSPARSRSPSLTSAPTASNVTDASPGMSNTPGSIDTEASHNPFSRGMMTLEQGQECLDMFRSRMSPHFPFVMIQESVTIQSLAQDRPALCVAVLAASCHENRMLQRELGRLFHEIVLVRMMKGPFATLDMLQGLLVHLACSAVLLQKSHHFRYSPYILECCHKLLASGSFPTDRHLPYIIYLQKLTEEVDDAVIEASGTVRGSRQGHLPAELQRIRERYTTTKSSLPFPLSESPTILLQLHVLDLIICQPSPDGISYGPNGFQSLQQGTDQNRFLDWLSQSMSAAKSLISVVLLLPQGEEDSMPNIGWIMLYCAVSLAVRLDLVAAQPENSQTAGHLRRILDMSHTLRQIVLRMEAASGPNTGDIEPSPYWDLARRARRIERWYMDRCGPVESPEVGSIFASSEPSPANPFSGTDMEFTPSSFQDTSLVPSLQITGEPEPEPWMTNLLADLEVDPAMENLLFTGPFDFLGER